MTTLGELVRDCQIHADAAKEAEKLRKVADERLVNALALIGNPLPINGRVVIGSTIVSRPYEMLPLRIEVADWFPDSFDVQSPVPSEMTTIGTSGASGQSVPVPANDPALPDNF